MQEDKEPLPFIWSQPALGSALPTPLAPVRTGLREPRIHPPSPRLRRVNKVYMAFQPARFIPPGCCQPESCALTTRFHPYLVRKTGRWRLFSATLSMPFPKNRDELRRLGGAVLCVVRTFLPERRQSGLRFFYFLGQRTSQISVLA